MSDQTAQLESLLREMLDQRQAAPAAAVAAIPAETQRAPAVAQRPRRKSATTAEAPTAYEDRSLLLSEFAALALWIGFWVANGFFTALFVQQAATSVVHAFNDWQPAAAIPFSTTAAWGVGVLAHLIITLIEIHLWRSGRRGIREIIFAVGLLDVATSALGVQALAVRLGGGDVLLWNIGYTLLAGAIALLPERRIADHTRAIYHTLRS